MKMATADASSLKRIRFRTGVAAKAGPRIAIGHP
jgi:hypothetical protein